MLRTRWRKPVIGGHRADCQGREARRAHCIVCPCHRHCRRCHCRGWRAAVGLFIRYLVDAAPTWRSGKALEGFPAAKIAQPSVALICPTGKSVTCLVDLPVQPLSKKYSGFPKTQISPIYSPSRPSEGRFAIVTDAGRDAVDASGASDEGMGLRTEKSCGPDTPTLVSSRWRQLRSMTVAKEPGRRGARKPLKPLRGECRVIPV
jgi:hypothetical protein